MIPDWREIEERLLFQARGAIDEIARTAPDEEFYGFYMDGNPETGHVCLGMNSEEALRRQIVWYRTRWPDRYSAVDDALLADELRWNRGDWHYQDLAGDGWTEIASALRTAIAHRADDGGPDADAVVADAAARVRELIRRVVLRLEQSGAFDQLKRTPAFRCLAGGPSDADLASLDGSSGCQWLRQTLRKADSGERS